MRAIYRDDFARAPPRRKQNAAWRLCPAKISIRKIFAAQVGESEFQRQTANATNLPQFWASRAAIETLRSANASPNFLFPKFSRRNLGRRRFQRQTLEAEGSNNKPRMKLPYHNFWPPASRVKRCVAPLFREIFRIQNFHGPSWRKQVPKTNHNPTNLPQFWAPRVAIETLRRANASPTFSFPKFSRRNPGGRRFQKQTLEAEGSNNTPRMKRPYHNFWPPASRAKRSVAPLPRQTFGAQNFRGPSWGKQVPKANRESNQLATILGLPRCNRNAASPQCFAKFFGPKIFATQPWKKKVPKANLIKK